MRINNILSVILIFLTSTIVNASEQMSLAEVNALPGGFSNPRLSIVHTLNLSNSGIDDNFIRNNLINNANLSRVSILDITGNQGITNQAIQDILNSNLLGSLRNMPQVSARYDCASSTIVVRARGTSIESPNECNSFELHTGKNFMIRYFNFTGSIYAISNNSMKFISVELN